MPDTTTTDATADDKYAAEFRSLAADTQTHSETFGHVNNMLETMFNWMSLHSTMLDGYETRIAALEDAIVHLRGPNAAPRFAYGQAAK